MRPALHALLTHLGSLPHVVITSSLLAASKIKHHPIIVPGNDKLVFHVLSHEREVTILFS